MKTYIDKFILLLKKHSYKKYTNEYNISFYNSEENIQISHLSSEYLIILN